MLVSGRVTAALTCYPGCSCTVVFVKSSTTMSRVFSFLFFFSLAVNIDRSQKRICRKYIWGLTRLKLFLSCLQFGLASELDLEHQLVNDFSLELWGICSCPLGSF